MKLKSEWLLAVVFAAALLVILDVWPGVSRYSYSDSECARVDRLTGQTEVLKSDHWCTLTGKCPACSKQR